MPDISLLPALADYFDVSIDYLLRGENTTKGDFLKAVTDRVIAHGYDDGYGEFLTVAAAAFRGIHAGNLRGCGVPRRHGWSCGAGSARGGGRVCLRHHAELVYPHGYGNDRRRACRAVLCP